MESLLPIIIQIVTGVIAGDPVSSVLKQAALGPIDRTLAGAIGGVGRSFVLSYSAAVT